MASWRVALLEWVGLRTTLVGLGTAYLIATLTPLVVPAWRQMDATTPEAMTA